MGRIPVVQEPSVRTEGLPTPYERPFATPQGQGADFGNVLEGAAHVTAQFEQDARERADNDALNGAIADGKTIVNTKVRDPDPNGVGYAALPGDAAIKARDKTIATVNQSLDERNSKLTPEQQRLFEPHLRALKEEAFSHIISHESEALRSVGQANFRGGVDATMQTMQSLDVLKDSDKLEKQRSDLFQLGINRAKALYGNNASSAAISAIVAPELQTAALGTMQAALAEAEKAGDPSIAENAFKVVGKDLLKNHQKQIGGMVQALTAKAEISKGSQAVIGGATDSVILPNGGVVARVDGGKVAAGVANLKDDTPHLSEIQDTVEKKQARLDKVWTGAVGTVFDRVEGAALKGGGFDLDRASAVDIEWLRVNAPAQLLKLQNEDQRGTRAQSTKESHDAYSAMAQDMDARKDVYRDLSVPEVGQMAVDRGLNAMDRDKIRKLHDAIQRGGLSEAINSTVAKELLRAFPDAGDKDTREGLQGDLLDAAKDYSDRWSKETQGKVIPTVELRKFVKAELVSGKVQGTGLVFNDTVTRLEYQNAAKYRGKAFEPLNPTAATIPDIPKQGGPPVTAATPVAPAAPAPRAVPTPPAGKVNVFDKSGNWAGTIPDTPGQRKAAQNAGLKI